MESTKEIALSPLQLSNLWKQDDIENEGTLFEAVAQILFDRIGLYIATLSQNSTPFQEPYKTYLVDIFSAYGWLLRLRDKGNISAREAMEIFFTPKTAQSVCSSVAEKIAFLSQPLTPKDAIEGWGYIEERFFCGAALEGMRNLYELGIPECSDPMEREKIGKEIETLVSKVPSMDFRIRSMIRNKTFPEWVTWLSYLGKMAGRALRGDSDHWFLFLAHKLVPEENTGITSSGITLLANNCLFGWVDDSEARKNFTNAIVEIAQYEMPEDESARQEMSVLSMKVGADEVPRLFKTQIWNELLGTCLLLAHIDFRKIQEQIGFDMVWQLLRSLFDIQWQEDSEDGFAFQSLILWPASAREIYDRVCETYPDFMMDLEQFSMEVILPLCELGLFASMDAGKIAMDTGETLYRHNLPRV